MNTVQTRQQRMAEAAFGCVSARRTSGSDAAFKEYASFAKSFPALLHTAGLCQAVAFAQAKPGQSLQVLGDVMATMNDPDLPTVARFGELSRQAGPTEYLRLSRIALQAATWIKRYVEALEKNP
jgi:CRISPR-associated protein Cmr5